MPALLSCRYPYAPIIIQLQPVNGDIFELPANISQEYFYASLLHTLPRIL
jgi:hypothetical protein